jgi:hypothetical protein
MAIKSVEAGLRHRELVARKSREISRSAREIAPLPPMKNPQRRREARKSFKIFCEQYFPMRFKLKWSSYHLKVIERIENIIFQGGGKLALAMPRGSGKTTLIETAVIWAVLYGLCRFIIVIGANKDAANAIIKSIKQAITENKKLLEDFPEAVYPFHKLNGSALLARGQLFLGELTNIIWKPDMVVFPKIPGSRASGATIITVGIKGAIRGKKIVMPDGSIARPDTILLDDIGTKKDAESPKLTAKLISIIDEDVEGLVGPGEEMAMLQPCTIIREGDVAWTYLNPNLKAHWHGMKFKMVERMPDRMDLWLQYREIRKEDEDKANLFYKKNRTEMQAGAIVAWEANYSSDELDALHHAMNIWSDNEATFQCEYQNEPFPENMGTVVMPAEFIRSQLNGLERYVVPMDVTHVTGFVDVHHDLHYFVVVGWTDDFTGYIIDYGTHPEQRRKYFFKSDRNLITISTGKEKRPLQSLIQEELINILKDLHGIHYRMENDENGVEEVRFSKILVDSGFVPEIVETAIRRVGQSIISPSKGIGVQVTNKPMLQWRRSKGRKFGTYWYEDRPQGRAFRTITIDTNYWKRRVHEAFSVGSGSRGGLSFFGNNPETHLMISEHCNAETAKYVEHGENKWYEWELLPGRDNHFFDCLVGCMAAASTLGIKLPTEVAEKRPVIK